MRALLLLLLFSTTALADDAGMLRCRAIKDSSARLACYDALVVPGAAEKASPSAPAQVAPSSQPASRAAAQSPPEQFGLEYRKAETMPDSIESTIPGRFEGWGPNARIALANGQVWQVTDDSSGFHAIDNPKVRIRRGALGAFYLEIEGTNRSPRVKRLK
jgi:hypothetical protein